MFVQVDVKSKVFHFYKSMNMAHELMEVKHCWVYSYRHVYGDIYKHYEAGVVFDSRNKYKM